MIKRLAVFLWSNLSSGNRGTLEDLTHKLNWVRYVGFVQARRDRVTGKILQF
jgi:hypothetical protein